MMRKLLALLLMALSAGTVFAGGGGSTTTYYSALKAQVSSNSSGMGKVYAGTSQTAGAYTAPSSTSSSQSTTMQNGTKTFYAFAQANEGYEFKGWSETDNGTDLGTASPLSPTVACSSTSSASPTTKTLYATFAEKVLAAFDITFQTGSDGTYTVNGAAPANLSGLTRATKVTLASTDAAFFAWSIDGGKVYDNPYERTFTSAATVGAVFLTAASVATVTTYDELAAALANDAYLKVVVPAGSSVAVDAGKTLTVPVGKLLVNEGTVFVEGTLTNSGTISGGGKISSCARLFTQANKNGEWGPTAEPVYSWPSPKVVYWVTKMQSNVGKVTGVSGALQHVTFRNGRGDYIRTTPTGSVPLVLACKVDGSIAMNHVTGISKTFSSGLDAYNGGYSSGGLKVITGGASYTAEAGNKFSHSWGLTDCAENQVTLSSELGGGSGFKFLNGKVKISGSIQATDCYFINCTSVTASSYHTDKTKVQHLRFFDTTGISINGSSMGKGGDGAAFYSGKFDDNLSGFAKCKVYAYTDENGKVFGGAFENDPNKYLADNVTYEAKQRESDNYWVVQIKKQPVYVAVSDGVEYEDLSEAISKSTSGVIALKKHIELDAPVTIPEGKSITLELAGYNITGANGVFVNNGSLAINDGSHNDLPSMVSATSGNLFENNGTMEITCGTYSGAVLLNGGNFITHGGTFNVTLAAGTGVTDKSAVADLRGGKFMTNSQIAETTKTVEAATWYSGGFLDQGYVAVPHEGMLWVGYGTYATAQEITLSGTDKAWELTALSAADQKLYAKNPATREECANDAEWRRFLELQSMITPYKTEVIDCVLEFDRAIVSGSISAKVGSFSMSLDEDIPANTQYSALIPRITMYQIQYSRFVYDKEGIYDDLICGVKNNSINNIGTTCTIYLYLKTQTRDQNIGGVWTYTYPNFRPIAAETFTFTGKGAIFDGTDYTSLQAALTAANYAGTVLLSKDCTEQVTVSRATSFVLDTNSFAFTGSIAAGDGFELKTEDLGDGRTRYMVVRTAAVSTSNVLAVKRVPGIDGAAAGTEVVAAVPWKNVALTADVTVDRLIATGVATGDEIAAWDSAQKKYYVWHYTGTAWEPATDARTNVEVPAANAYTLARGTAVWYKRANPSVAYSQVGGYDTNAVATVVTQGGTTSANKPANTLLINPYYEAVDLAQIAGANGDQIQILSNLKVYTNKGGKWGELQLETVSSPFGPVKQQKFVEVATIPLPAGEGFWYISKGGQPEIDWKALAPSSAAPQE